jgi:aconitate hydratase 2/2-methylisocitrate dehydratase
MGKGAQVYLGSAELAAVVSMLGRFPTPDEYRDIISKKLAGKEADVYKYLNFHKMPFEEVKEMLEA